MGRNKGDASRSKFRASSSSLAASLLQTPVISAVGFGGFVGSARVDSGPSVDSEHLADVDGDAVPHLKRLTKKDPTTKLKALAALTVIFEERPAAELSALLPAWVFEYKRLVQDNSRQVRLSAHSAMASLAGSVGRGLAPHLRSVMGAWWVSQFDPSREVSEAAQNSFQVAFSGQKKRLEALVFCGNEIFSQLDDNLKLTPQTISDKATPIEESTEKYERVVSCSLLALAALIDVLVGSVSSSSSPDNRENKVDREATAKTRSHLKEAAAKLCWNHKFLRQFMKAKSSRIRSASYQALRAFIQHLPEVFKAENMDTVVLLILGTFIEKDPACHQPMWDMVLLFAKEFPQSWETSIVNKIVFPRLWGFLRHGCYGSQQVSYPYLLPLISLLPVKAIAPVQNFFLEFFNSIWQGRSAPQMALADFVALLKATQECLIWSLSDAKRFSDAESSEAVCLQRSLIDGVLFKLLWHDYVGADPMQKITSPTSVGDSIVTVNFTESPFSSKASGVSGSGVSPKEFTQELRSCIVHTVESLSRNGDQIMGPFWDEFQGMCFRIVQEAGILWQSVRHEDKHIARIAEFFIALGNRTPEGGNREQWCLIHAVRPFVANSFPAIRSLGHPESIRLIAKLTRMFGPQAFSLLSVSKSKESLNDRRYKDQGVQDLEGGEGILQYFKKEIVLWCLDGNGDLNDPKAEVIMAFLENHSFRKEWNFVLAHLTAWQRDEEDKIDLKQVGVLATLLENIRARSYDPSVNGGKMNKDSIVDPAWWKCPTIDAAVFEVASSSCLAHPDCVRLLRSALGGASSEQSSLPIVSDKAAMQIFEKLLMHIVSVLSASAGNWVRSAASVIVSLGTSDSIHLSNHGGITEESLQLAAAAINVLGSCIFSLVSVKDDQSIGVQLLAALFCLNWACSDYEDARVFSDGYDSADKYYSNCDSDEDTGADDADYPEISCKMNINEATNSSGSPPNEPSTSLEQAWGGLQDSLVSVRHKISSSFCRSFSALIRFRLCQVLVKCLRLAVLDEEFDTSQGMAVRCAAWAQELVGYACKSPEEVSEFINLLITPAGDSWPIWAVPPSTRENKAGRDLLTSWGHDALTATQLQRHDRFIAFVDHLCRSLGLQRVFLGSVQLPDTEGTEEILAGEQSEVGSESCQIWLVVELLCTWEWSGGSSLRHIVPFLWSLARSTKGSNAYRLLWGTIEALFVGGSRSSLPQRRALCPISVGWVDDIVSADEPFLRALLVLLKGLLEKEDRWGKADTIELFCLYVTRREAADLLSPCCDVQILPHVLSVLMPILRKRGMESTGGSIDDGWESFLQTAVSLWLEKAFTMPPLATCESDLDIPGNQWIRVAVACFPLNSAGGAAAMASASSAPVSSQERMLLLELLRKQFSREAIAAVAAFAAMDRSSPVKEPARKGSNMVVEVTLAKLVAAAIGYCWLEFGTGEWEFILRKLRGWLQEAVIEVEEITESVFEVVKGSMGSAESEGIVWIIHHLESIVALERTISVELYSTAVSIFSLLKGLNNLEGVESTDSVTNLKLAGWEILQARALEDILRILLAIGLAESAAANAGESSGNVISTWRKSQSQLWDNVADVALSASSHAREAAIRAVDLWGVGKGAISALYALLFSSHPTISLQWVAYHFISTGQVLEMAVTYGVVSGETKSEVEDDADVEAKLEQVRGADSKGMLPANVAQIRPELASILETNHDVIIRSSATSSLRVSYFLGWSLFLTRLQSLTALSATRERLVQYVQDSDISSTLLDCLFQHIPLEQSYITSGSRRRNVAAGVKMSSAAAPATRASATGSVAFAVEGLWPVQKEGLINLAGAIYGLMLLVLPACVRVWFTGLRDKSLASAIEAFTTTHCSPQLLADEFAQVQASALDENLSIRANRSLREVTAIYKKEEAGMDIVIRIPSCYPLRAVDVDCTRQMGVKETLLRKWILSMASFLRNQNGAVAEAVRMWKKNVDRKFEGVEECPICYSIIHTSNHNLPRLACKTCRHKFHSACLYKWFSTSHQSTCPLCKTPF